ncbi:peptidase M14 [Stappia sp.]|uniref:peptidase M14 n=1 Tax=Stappia sp. TaxID=1870903 RepID=UPI0025EFD8D2|nr:peptidase M14 [Stappia sp.]|tara:strand:+ start:597 stop:2327 length:1731 start_codon:yes stop_codon:yes gene_type:complete
MLLFQKSFPRTLEVLAGLAREGELLEAWTFDDVKARRSAEKRLEDCGIQARVRSAYKPLLHAFLEELSLEDVERVVVRYPLAPIGLADRFRLEAYPLAALVGDRELIFDRRSDDGLFYEVELTHSDGCHQVVEVLAPNHAHTGIHGEKLLSPTGWVRIDGRGPGARLESDLELAFHETVREIARHDWGTEEPFFEELNIRVEVPARDRELPFGDEVVSISEALHEDLYFTLLEVFAKRTGRQAGDRTLKPGQIVPEISGGAEAVSVSVSLRELDVEDIAGERMELEGAEDPPDAKQIRRVLDSLGGVRLSAPTRSGRQVLACHVPGKDAAVMISGGQHANEGTGIVGALRAGLELGTRDDSHFVLSPLENPDGYALFRRLVAGNPRHMHHAARYTAFGDDMEYRVEGVPGESLFETEIRSRSIAASGAKLHVTLHGYPAHEWVRPFSGYVPHGFEAWTLPKGFFLILRHHAGWREQAEALLEKVTSRLSDLSDVLALTARQLEIYRIHAGEPDLRMVNGFPCMVAEDPRSQAPVVLISEYPDETVHGEDFRLGQDAQRRTALAAYGAWQEILPRSV